ncbi:sodium channel modifier 1-like isoform X2 [Centruroides sculpturatus]|uniref:sodium channel modifier 1-like isoform X2 n=1 Tax=Centruroides sculpturatus TaxID=218467 RepID=UPI000C6EE944|nr:sodium channel modifier 1-like isoform X2 [Centruroides sculpturatus]XP_023227932.1 sodium channel modifier 1-like isoform X2 [Centruroides sculpturatus]
MSFKRDGDDTSLLNNLKRRRISELLVCHIPEDEALLLKNGRYACTICHHKPIFDTIDMLAIHRKGKKHLTYLTCHLETQQKLKLKNNAISLNDPVKTKQSKQHQLLKAKPYGRKLKIDIPFQKKDVQNSADILQTTNPCSTNALIKSYIKNLSRKKEFSKAVEKTRINSLGPKKSEKIHNTENKKEEKVNPSNETETQQPYNEKKMQQIEFYLRARSSGWKKDKTGKWIKEEGVEFDSDEEPPDDNLS